MYNFEDLTAKEALEIIEPIPSEKFITCAYDGEGGTHCTLGFIIEASKGEFRENKFREKTNRFIQYKTNQAIGSITTDIIRVNDTKFVNGWNHPVIKHRVVAFLTEMVEWENAQLINTEL